MSRWMFLFNWRFSFDLFFYISLIVPWSLKQPLHLTDRSHNEDSPSVSGTVLFAGGAFEDVIGDNLSPFGYLKGEGIDAGYGEHDWICKKDKERTDAIFATLGPVEGRISGQSKWNSYVEPIYS